MQGSIGYSVEGDGHGEKTTGQGAPTEEDDRLFQAVMK